jgi:hypothetical protein
MKGIFKMNQRNENQVFKMNQRMKNQGKKTGSMKNE